MSSSITEQIHRSLVAEEEARCKALEAQTKKSVARREVAPWKRLAPGCLTQDPELLARITEYSYDLHSRRFRRYCAARSVLHVAGERGSRRRLYMTDTRKRREQFLADPEFQYAKQHNGRRCKYTAEDLASAWRIVQLGRAALQDAWELYCLQRSRRAAQVEGNSKRPRPRAPRRR